MTANRLDHIEARMERLEAGMAELWAMVDELRATIDQLRLVIEHMEEDAGRMARLDLDQVSAVADVRRIVGEGLNRPFLPLWVAEPGPLMVRAVEVAAGDGLTLQHLRVIFDEISDRRFARGLEQLRSSGKLFECREPRPNKAGRDQAQVVFRAA